VNNLLCAVVVNCQYLERYLRILLMGCRGAVVQHRGSVHYAGNMCSFSALPYHIVMQRINLIVLHPSRLPSPGKLRTVRGHRGEVEQVDDEFVLEHHCVSVESAIPKAFSGSSMRE
jgi:hypothetical protein